MCVCFFFFFFFFACFTCYFFFVTTCLSILLSPETNVNVACTSRLIRLYNFFFLNWSSRQSAPICSLLSFVVSFISFSRHRFWLVIRHFVASVSVATKPTFLGFPFWVNKQSGHYFLVQKIFHLFDETSPWRGTWVAHLQKRGDSAIVVSEFELQLRYFIHFQTYPSKKAWTPLIPQIWVNSTTIVLLQGWLWYKIAHKGSYSIKQKKGARGVMVIVVRDGHGDMSSIPGWDWLHFT